MKGKIPGNSHKLTSDELDRTPIPPTPQPERKNNTSGQSIIDTYRREWVEIHKVDVLDIETSGYHVIQYLYEDELQERRYPLPRELALKKALEFLGYDSSSTTKTSEENEG